MSLLIASFLCAMQIVAARTNLIQDKATDLFNKLLGKYIYTNLEKTKDTAVENVRTLNWQHISYIFILTSVLVRLPFLVNLISKNQVTRQSSKFADSNKHKALMVLLALGTFEGLYLLDKLNPLWSYVTVPANNTMGWFGLAIGTFAIAHLVYLHSALGSAWSATITVQKDHALKIRGPYRYARHPMYLNFLLHPIAVLLISQNWLEALIFTPWVLYAISRVKREERLLIDQFGQSYVDYMHKVPALGPLDKLLGRNLGLTHSEAQMIVTKRETATERKDKQ
jgi:protein-S-isoprenylcysteine O-methyltransferase Ste14